MDSLASEQACATVFKEIVWTDRCRIIQNPFYEITIRQKQNGSISQNLFTSITSKITHRTVCHKKWVAKIIYSFKHIWYTGWLIYIKVLSGSSNTCSNVLVHRLSNNYTSLCDEPDDIIITHYNLYDSCLGESTNHHIVEIPPCGPYTVHLLWV